MVSVLAWVIFHAPLAHAKTDTRFLLYQKKPVSENCNCFQSTISKIAVILSQSFPKRLQFFALCRQGTLCQQTILGKQGELQNIFGVFYIWVFNPQTHCSNFYKSVFCKKIATKHTIPQNTEILVFLFKMFKMLFKISENRK